MEVRSILVSVGVASGHAGLTYAAHLAETFGAEVVGVASAEPNLAYAGVDNSQVAIDFYAMERKNIEAMLERAEERFRSAMPASVPVHWRSYIANTTNMLIEQARRCDVVVVAPADASSSNEALDVGHLVLASGRPVITVGNGKPGFGLDRIVIAWKDTREARRAVSDALPLLQRAKQVKAVTRSEGDFGAETAYLNDLVEWLKLHGVTCESQLVEQGVEFVDALGLLSLHDAPDLVVSGGFGHSRFREWLFGGVTRDLLDTRDVTRLFSN